MTRVRFAVRLLRWAGAAVLGLAVLVMLALWRLSMGPVDLDFARAYTSRSFDTPEGPMSLEARRVSLVWGGWQEPLQLVLSDIAATDRSGMRVATVPAVVINLSLRSLAGGALQPTEIDIDNVRLDVVITREGLLETVLPQEEGSASRMLPVLLEQLLNEPDRNHPLGLLSQVRIHSARVRIEDRATGFVWDAPSARATMVRDKAGVRIQGALTVQAGGHSTEFQLAAFYGRSREQLDINLRGQNLRPSAFAAAAPQLAPLADIDLPMDGAIRLTASGNGAIRQVSLELHGGAGRIGVPGVLSPPRAVDRAALRLSFAPAENRVRLEEFSVDFQGPQASLTGILELRERNFRFEGNARIKDVPIARLAEFWLEPLAPGGRRWTLANISDGRLTSAALDFAVVGDFDHADSLRVERSLAEMRYDGLTVRYLDPLPPLKGVSGTATFDGKVMRFDVASGQAEALTLDGARVDILGLEGPDNHRADMEVRIRAKAPDTMAFLAHPKIGLRKDLLFNPKRVAGDVAIALRLKLPLNRDVAMGDVEYAAVADIERFALQNAVAGLNLTDAAARLEVDGEEMKVSGRGKVEGQTLEIQWRELFGEKVPFRRRYEVKGPVSQATLAKAGLSALSDYASGTILFAPLVYQVPATGPAELTIKANLKEARLSVPELKWEKAAGRDGQVTLSARFGAGPVPRVTDFDVRAGDLAAAGRLELQPSDGSLQRVTLSRFRLGSTDIAGEIRNTGNGYAIDVRGATLDVARFLDDEKPERDDTAAPAPPRGGPVMSITVDVGQLVFKRGGWSAVKGSLTRQADRVLAADLQFTGGTAAPSRLTVRAQEGGRQVVLQSPDTGSLLQAAGWLDGLAGGELEVVMRLDDTKAGSPLTSRVEMRRFRLVSVPPVPGRDVANLNAVIEQIGKAGNAGQVFDKLEARIDKSGNTLIIRNARASGDSVGITARGTYRLDSEEICLGGAVTPAYVLNAFLSNIPIIGWILTGGEGRGLFAINYSVRGPIDNPKGDVDAATAITPGFLRRMMEGTCGIYEEMREGSRTPQRSLEEQQQDRIGH